MGAWGLCGEGREEGWGTEGVGLMMGWYNTMGI